MARSLTQDRDPGLYGPDSEAWRLNRESMLLLGAGPRALLLQIAHPSVAAGVNDHSDFRADPWKRLQGTLWSFLRIVYGTTPAARAEIRRLNRLHTTIVGEGYHARDPELSMWVHATLVDSTIVAADAWLEPIDRERRARFYDETKPIGRAFGIPESLLPADLDAFEAYLDAMLGPAAPSRWGPSRASWRRRSCIRHSPGSSGRSRSRPSPTTGRCGRASGLLPPRSAMRTGSPGTRAIGSSRAGSWPAGAPGTRSCPRPSARCRRPEPRTAASRADPGSSPIGPVRPSFTHPVAQQRGQQRHRDPDPALDRAAERHLDRRSPPVAQPAARRHRYDCE